MIDSSNGFGFGFRNAPGLNQSMLGFSLDGNNPSFATAHQKHAWTYALIKARADAVGSVPVRIYQGARDDKRPAPDNHPLQELFGRPNPSYSESVMWRLLMHSMDKQGFGMILFNPTTTGKPYAEGQVPDEMWAVDPKDFKAIIMVNGKETPYHISPGLFKDLHRVVAWQNIKNPDWRFPKHQMLYHEYPEGAPITAARLSIEADYSAANYSKAFVQNDCNPSGWFESAQRAMSDTQYKQFRERTKQEHQGAANAGKPMLLENNVTWTPNPNTHRDMQWIEGRALWLDEMCGVFKVPKAILNVGGDAKYSNHLSQQRVFMEGTVAPLHRDIMDVFWSQLFSQVEGGKYWGEFDTSGVSAMQSDLADRAAIGVQFTAAGFPINEVNDRLNLGFQPVDGGDVGLVNSGLVPISDASAPFEDEPAGAPAPTQDTEADLDQAALTAIMDIVAKVQAGTLPAESAKAALSLVYGLNDQQVEALIGPADEADADADDNSADPADDDDRVITNHTHGSPCPVALSVKGFRSRPHLFLSAIKARAASRQRAFVKAKRRARVFRGKEIRKREKRFASKTAKMFMDQKKQLMGMLAKIIDDRRTEGRKPSNLTPDDIMRVEFDRRQWDEKLAAIFEPTYRDMIDATGKDTLKMVSGDPLVFDATNPKWTKLINERIADEMVGVNQETIVQVRRSLMKGLRDGDTPQELMGRLQKLPAFNRARARVVAVTEMGSVVNSTRAEQYDEYNVKDIIWVTSGKGPDVTRPTHIEAENQGSIERGETFENGLRWPHDVMGSAEEVINCECSLMVAIDDESIFDGQAFKDLE